MTVAKFVDVCRFTPASSGTGDFVVSAAVTGYLTPAGASAVNGNTYHYRAESADLSQWEVGEGVYTSGTTTLARTTIFFSSSGGAKVSFSAVPQVALTLLAEDLGALQPGQIPGIGTNTAASAGNVGELISSQILSGSAVSLTTAVAKDITSVSLTAGEWACDGNVWVIPAGNITTVEGWISTTSATQPTRPNNGANFKFAGITSATQVGTSLSSKQILISSTTTVYLGVISDFTSTATAYGVINCRRVR